MPKWSGRNGARSSSLEKKGRLVLSNTMWKFPNRGPNSPPTSLSSKYFRAQVSVLRNAEHSVKQVRLAQLSIPSPRGGREDSYFTTEEDAGIFAEELTQLLIRPEARPSIVPSGFNVGVESYPQCSACSSFPSKTKGIRSSIGTAKRRVDLLRVAPALA